MQGWVPTLLELALIHFLCGATFLSWHDKDLALHPIV